MVNQIAIAIYAFLLGAASSGASNHGQADDAVSLLQVVDGHGSISAKRTIQSAKRTNRSAIINTSCLATDEARIYKYTIASSLAHVDAAWAVDTFGATYTWEAKEYETCEPTRHVGKATSFKGTADYVFYLHFIYNPNTNAGPLGMVYWDDYLQTLHKASFETNTYNAFMDSSHTIYTLNMTKWLETTGVLEKGYLVRKIRWGQEWQYSIMISSPSGKMFEVISSELNEDFLGTTVAEWTAEECPSAHVTGYSSDELKVWYAEARSQFASIVDIGDNPVFLPIRSSVAVKDAAAIIAWYKTNLPGIGRGMHLESTGICDVATSPLGFVLKPSLQHQVRFVRNPNLPIMGGSHSVSDFVDYMESVNNKYGGINGGWSAWYDRHFGIEVSNCKLDMYMESMEENDVNFHPHGMDSSNALGSVNQHVWTEGTQGWGLELQGEFDWTYANCYAVFDWCTADTDPDTPIGWSCKD